jgi:nucleotide-binding universal stress UspA family protein
MMKILLAVDDSKFSEAATQAVLRQARPQDTEVRVLNVMEPSSSLWTASGGQEYYAAIDTSFQEATNRSKALVAKTEELLRSKGFKVSSSASAEWADPKSKIIDVAAEWDADLIVLGSHGRSGMDRFLMGSVSEAVARHAPCSVEIVRIPRAANIGSSAMATDDAKKCAHSPCTCTPRSGRYCSAHCEAMGERSEIDCRCGHPDCRGKAH